MTDLTLVDGGSEVTVEDDGTTLQVVETPVEITVEDGGTEVTVEDSGTTMHLVDGGEGVELREAASELLLAPAWMAAGNDNLVLENEDSVDLLAGAAITFRQAGGIERASAGGYACHGLLLADTAVGHAGPVGTDGKVELADWTAVAGEAELVPGAIYWLSETLGKITRSVPSTGRIQRLGVAAGIYTLDLEIQAPIKL